MLGCGPCPVSQGKNVGVIVDSSLSLSLLINRTVSTCFGIIMILRKISHFLSFASRKQAVIALVMSRLDSCNALYLGINKGLVHRLQLVQNAAAKLVMDFPNYHSVSVSLSKLHWLPLNQRILFKALSLTRKAFYGLGPDTIQRLCQCYVPTK